MVHQNDGRKVGGIPLRGFGSNDVTIDIDPETNPDFCLDVRELGSLVVERDGCVCGYPLPPDMGFKQPRAVLVDRPYSTDDAANYRCGADVLPNLEKLVADCLRIVMPGGMVGVLDYLWPRMRGSARNVAAVAVGTGEGNRARWFTVWRGP